MKRFCLYTAALLVAAGLTAFLFLEPILNMPWVKAGIVNRIETQTGTRIDPAQLTFQLTPHPGIQVTHLTLPLTRGIDLAADTVLLDLDIPALLRKKIWTSRVFFKNLHIRTVPGENGPGVTFHDPLAFQFPKEQMTRMFALLPDSENQVQVILENSATQQFSALTGSLWISKTDETLQFDTQIQDLHVTKQWLARFFSAPDVRVDQVLSADARLHVRMNPETGITGKLGLNRFEIISHRLGNTPVSGGKTQMHFSYQPDRVSFHLDPTPLEYPLANVSMAFENNRSQGKTALTFTGSQIDIAQAREASLAMASDSQVVEKLFDILREGAATDVSVGFHAASWQTLFDPENLVLEGTARNSTVKIPNTPLLAREVSGTAGVSDGILTIRADTGSIEQSKMHGGTLSIELLHASHVPFTGEFDLDVNLAEMPAVLIRLLPDTSLAKEMALVSDLKGRARTRLVLTIEHDQPDLLVSVVTQPFSATGVYDRIPFPLSVSRAEFVYEDDEVRIIGLSGTIGKSRLTGATARVTIAESPHLDLGVENLEIDIQEAWPKLYSRQSFNTRVEPVKQMCGQLLIDTFAYKGPVFEWAKGEVDISGTGRDVRIGFTPETHEILDLAGRFHVTENRFSLSGLSARIMDLNWLSGRISSTYASGITLPLSVEAGEIDFNDKGIFAAGQALPAPNVRLTLQLAGTGLGDLKPDVIHLEHKPLTSAVIRFDHAFETPHVRFEGRLDTRTLDTFLDKQSLFFQGLTALTRGEPVEIASDGAGDLDIHFRRVQMDALWPAMEDSPFSRDAVVFFWKNLNLRVDRLVYKTFHLTGLDCEIIRDPHYADIVLRDANFCGVDLSGRMEMDLTAPDRAAVSRMKVSAANRDNIGSLLSCLYPEIHLMEGPYSLNAELSGTGTLKTLHTDLTGDISFASENGRIHKMTLLSRLLSVLNILKLPDIRQEGFRYHRIEVAARAENGGIHLEKAVIDAENMALFFTGEIFPFENRLDLTCLVAPFKTIDSIIQFIPVVNTILDGRLVSFPAKATGPIDDPVITPLHPSAVGEGLINMFTSLLKSPARLFEGAP